VLLRGDDGVEVELRIAGYQFPDAEVDPVGRGWDANWLVIAGRVRTAPGEEWTFRDPGLTTWEVAEVADWLEQAARDQVDAVPSWTHADDEEGVSADGPDDQQDDDQPYWWDVLGENGWLVFVEPCLSLGVAGRASERVEVLVGLGAEWAAPPLTAGAHDWTCVAVRVTPEQLRAAVEELRAELAEHPPR
jgi:hypothetical protein